ATSDSRLRRSQALALENGVGLDICRTLINAKLEGQERMARERLNSSAAAEIIAGYRERLPKADTADAIRVLEAHAAVAYFGAWKNIPVQWPKADLGRLPNHWLKAGRAKRQITRAKAASHKPREAVFHVRLSERPRVTASMQTFHNQ